MPPRGTQTVKNIPEKDKMRVVVSFEAEGATVKTERQPDGRWTVIAKFPDE
jgi:hypothetical protein